MKLFSEQVNERRVDHLRHVEDMILDGTAGVAAAKNILNVVAEALTMKSPLPGLDISLKWDGAPTVVFGPDPADGKFFVSTKAAFNKSPKLPKSHEDIDALFDNPNVRRILHLAFDYLTTLNPGVILQGDVLFTRTREGEVPNCELKKAKINRDHYLIFKPNTLTYACPMYTPLAEDIENAYFGIALHTKYVSTGTTLADIQAMPIDPGTFAMLRTDGRTWLVNANYDISGDVQFTDAERQDFELAGARAAEIQIGDELFWALEPKIWDVLGRYLNSCVRGNVRSHYLGFLNFFVDERNKEVTKRSTDKGRMDVLSRYNQMIDMIRMGKPQLLKWFALHEHLTVCKSIILTALNRSQADYLKVFTHNDVDGWTPTQHEGFVVHVGGKIAKLVDRYEFSRLNFNAARTFGQS